MLEILRYRRYMCAEFVEGFAKSRVAGGMLRLDITTTNRFHRCFQEEGNGSSFGRHGFFADVPGVAFRDAIEGQSAFAVGRLPDLSCAVRILVVEDFVCPKRLEQRPIALGSSGDDSVARTGRKEF